jgi:hypothetical protein
MKIVNNHYERYKLRRAGRVISHRIVACQATKYYQCSRPQVHRCPKLIVLGGGDQWCAWSVSLPPNVVTDELTDRYGKWTENEEGQEAKAI